MPDVNRHPVYKSVLPKRETKMKFAIPIADGKLTAHFGHCKEFAMVEVEEKQILNTEMLDPPPHEPGVLPRWLKTTLTPVATSPSFCYLIQKRDGK
jgi:hypothetical protein